MLQLLVVMQPIVVMRLRGSVKAIHNSAVTGYDVTCIRIDDSGDNDSATAKLDTPITLNNFICDTVGVTFNKEDPVAGSVIEEELVLMQIWQLPTHPQLWVQLRLPLSITVPVSLLIQRTLWVQWIRHQQLHGGQIG